MKRSIHSDASKRDPKYDAKNRKWAENLICWSCYLDAHIVCGLATKTEPRRNHHVNRENVPRFGVLAQLPL